MINPKNKRVQVTLPGETVELLQSLSTRYNKSSSEIVKWAINVLASKKAHNFVIKLREQDPTEIKSVVLGNKEYEINDNSGLSQEEWERLCDGETLESIKKNRK